MCYGVKFPAFVRGEAYAKFVSGIERVIRETIGKTGETYTEGMDLLNIGKLGNWVVKC